jgi:hypothetical protein
MDYSKNKESQINTNEIITTLKEELAVRDSNTCTISGEGGNLHQYLWVMSTGLKHQECDVPAPEFVMKNNKPVFKCPPNSTMNMVDMRSLFNSFVKDLSIPAITEEQVIDETYMAQYKGLNSDMDALLECIHNCHILIDFVKSQPESHIRDLVAKDPSKQPYLDSLRDTPMYIKLMPVRLIIGIEVLLKYNFDEVIMN